MALLATFFQKIGLMFLIIKQYIGTLYEQVIICVTAKDKMMVANSLGIKFSKVWS